MEWLEGRCSTLTKCLHAFQNEVTYLRIRLDEHERGKTRWQESINQPQQQLITQRHQEITRLQDQLQAQQQSAIASPNSTNASSVTSSSIENSVNSSDTLFEECNWATSCDLRAENCLNP